MFEFAYPISRKSFKAKACIDWLEIRINTSCATQFHHIQNAFEEAGCGKLWVEAIAPGNGGVTDTFAIRFHDELANDITALRKKLDRVAKCRYQMTGDPIVTAIEIACDFWHKGPPAARIRDTFAMTYRLQSSLFAPGKVRKFDPEEDGATTRFMDREGERITPGCTFYVGNKADDLMWRVYFKHTDMRLDSGAAKRLPQAKWRARVEVALRNAALSELGLRTLADLESYRFDRLARLFKFRRPRDPKVMASGDLFKLTAIVTGRRINDATPARGIHSFNGIGRKDYRWRNKMRSESSHIEVDHELQDAVKGALKRLSV